MGAKPDRNAFVLGPVEITARELEKRQDKTTTDVVEIKDTVEALEPTVITPAVNSSGVFTATVVSFNDATQVAQVDTGSGVLPMVNYSARVLAPNDIVACAYLLSDPTTAIVIGVFRPQGYITPEFTAPVVPLDFPIFGEGLPNPIIGDVLDTNPLQGVGWEADRTNQLGYGEAAVIGWGRFSLPVPYSAGNDPTDLVIYDRASGVSHFFNSPRTGVQWRPFIAPGCLFVNNGRPYRFEGDTHTWTELSTRTTLGPIIAAGGNYWILEDNPAGFTDYVTRLPLTGVIANGDRAVTLPQGYFGANSILTTGGPDSTVWVVSPWGVGYFNALLQSPTFYSILAADYDQDINNPFVTRDNSGTDSSGNLISFLPTTYDQNGLPAAYIALRFNATFAPNPPIDTIANPFDPALLPLEIHQVTAAGNAQDSVYVLGIVLAELIDSAYAGTGAVMPAMWQVTFGTTSISSSLIWTGTERVAVYAKCRGFELEGVFNKMRWMVVTSDGYTNNDSKETYLYEGDI